MKRYIKSTFDNNENIESIIIDEFGSKNPGTGCSFIAPDGTFVNIYPRLDIHEDLCDWIENAVGIELEYKDEEYFVREFSWIRLRTDPTMFIIELPKEKPTNQQWYSLEDWLYFAEEKYFGKVVSLYLNICDNMANTNVEYRFGKDLFTEDVMKLLKRYYSSGKLYASTSTDSVGTELDSEGNVVPPEISSALKNSKVRNRKGQLIVCYHGTNTQFDEFKEDFISSNSGNIGWFGKGFYFTNSEKLAKSYGSVQKKCYLNITKPFVYSSPDSVFELLTLGVNPRSYEGRLQPYAYLEDETPIDEFTEAIKKAGYDGVKFSYKQAKYKPNVSGVSDAVEFVCFSPNQVYFLN